jgi:hypothetical protein
VLANIPTPGATSHPDEDVISFDELFENGAWLNLFNNDLKAVSRSLAHSKMLEIDSPQSPLLPGQNQQPDQTGRAKLGMRDRKRVRKGQLSRKKW